MDQDSDYEDDVFINFEEEEDLTQERLQFNDFTMINVINGMKCTSRTFKELS
jgi:hypothetical protein